MICSHIAIWNLKIQKSREHRKAFIWKDFHWIFFTYISVSTSNLVIDGFNSGRRFLGLDPPVLLSSVFFAFPRSWLFGCSSTFPWITYFNYNKSGGLIRNPYFDPCKSIIIQWKCHTIPCTLMYISEYFGLAFQAISRHIIAKYMSQYQGKIFLQNK